MYSIKFPDMLNSAGTNLVSDREATMSNLRLMLASWKNSLLGDPYFGTDIKRYIYEQNSVVLQDLIIDSIHLAIYEFMPQVYVTRDDIKISQKDDEVYVTIKCINTLDNQPDMYTIKLTEDGSVGK
jgi:hypothetical protein